MSGTATTVAAADPAAMGAHPRAKAVAAGGSVVVHGMHPMRGYPVTWHLTPVPGRPGQFLVERADGHIDDAAAWQFAPKESAVMSVGEARALVERVTHLA